MYSTVVFDYGNTLCKMGCLVKSLEAVFFHNMARAIGSEIEEQIQRLYVPDQAHQPHWLDVWESAFEKHGVEFDKEVGLSHLRHFLSSGELYNYTVPLLQKLKSHGTHLVLLSNVTGETAEFENDLGMRGLSKLFDRIVWSSEIGYRKPSTEAYLAALSCLNSSKSTVLMVGDSEVADILGANNFGIDSMRICDTSSEDSSATYVVNRQNVAREILRLTKQSR
ncbi:HAD family hydrolase [Photobacterium kasasachensis]|uniref:HAD family hydrolase n=1 Tax=Photobacterium kasasachensis TaxID=2910240 RepID=UPI003D133C09